MYFSLDQLKVDVNSSTSNSSPRSSIPTSIGFNSPPLQRTQKNRLEEKQRSSNNQAPAVSSTNRDSSEKTGDRTDKKPAACMLGKLKLFNSKDNAKGKSSPTTREAHEGSSISNSAASFQNPERPEVVAASRDSTDAEAKRTVAKGPQEKRSAKGRVKDAHGIPGSNLPGPSSSLIPSMDDRKRVGPSATAAAAAMGRTATSGTHPRPSALPSSRTSSSSSISSLSGSGTLGTPVAGGLKAATASASKSAAKGYATSGTRSGQRQGTATAIATPTATSTAKSGKSGVPSGRSKPAKSPSTVGINQAVAKSPSTVGINQSVGKSPSIVGISQSVGIPPPGKMAAAKQISSARRPSESDDLNRNRSAGNSGSRTALNSISSGHGMTSSSSRSALQQPQTGRRDGSSSQPEQKRSPHQPLPGNHGTTPTEISFDPRRIPSAMDQGSSKASKTNQKYDAAQDRSLRQSQAKAANVRSPVTAPAVASAAAQSSRGRNDAGSGPDYGFPSVSSFKPISSSAAQSAGTGVAREAAPQTTKPRKIDSDTQTTASVMQSAHLRRQAGLAQQLAQNQHSLIDPRQRPLQGTINAQGQPVGGKGVAAVRNPERKAGLAPDSKDQSSSSLNSDSSTTASGLGDDSSKSGSNSASNSNNSASSTDSVIYRPSSCDESETGAGDSVIKKADAPRKDVTRQNGAQDAKGKPPTQFTDHISSLRNKRTEENQRLQSTGGSSGQQRSTRHGDGSPNGCQGKAEADRGGSMRDGSSGAGEEMMSFDVGIKPMQPIIRSSPYAYLRSIPVSLGRPSLHPSSSAGQAGSSSGASLSSSSRLGVHRPLLDPSNMYLSPGRCGISGGVGLSSGRFMRPSAEVQSDTEGFDVTAGYMSDGDILRSSYLEDVNCGYMSEGGLTQYVKRIQQRFREGMLAVKECMEKSNVLVDDDR